MSNKQIKSEAKAMLKGKWAMASIVTFIYMAVAGAGSGALSVLLSLVEELKLGMVVYVGVTFLNYVVIYLVQSVVLLGYIRIMMKIAAGENYTLGELFSYAKYTFKTFGLTLLNLLYTSLWSLLLIIPGIIKGISYSMAYYILADDPTKGANQCITESKELMKGNKGKYFSLLLSFFGWILLGMVVLSAPIVIVYPMLSSLGELAYVILILMIVVDVILAGIGMYILMPYIEVSRAKFYYSLIGKDESYDSE